MKLLKKLFKHHNRNITDISELKDFYLASNISKLVLVKNSKDYNLGLYIPFTKLNEIHESLEMVTKLVSIYNDPVLDIEPLYLYIVIIKEPASIESLFKVFISNKYDIKNDHSDNDIILRIKIKNDNKDNIVNVLSLMRDGYKSCINTLHNSVVYNVDINSAYVKLQLAENEITISKLTLSNMMKNSLYYDILEIRNNDMFVIDELNEEVPSIYKIQHCPSELDENSVIIDGILLKQIIHGDAMSIIDKVILKDDLRIKKEEE